MSGSKSLEGAGTDHPPAALDTVAVHGGEDQERGYHAVATPIVCTATYSFRDTAEIHAFFSGEGPGREEYGRYGNPTVRTAERKLAALEGAEEAALFGSGMAALSTLLFALLKPGDHLVITSDCYRRTRQLIGKVLGRFQIAHSVVEPNDGAALEAAMRPGKTRLIVSESPTNPFLRVLDLPAMAAVRDRHPGVKLLVDSTLASPVNQRALTLGADLVVHSCTKFLAGHNDVLAGVVCGEGGLIGALREFRGVVGGLLDPHSAYLLLRGLKTLVLRVQRQNQSALRVARWLEEQPLVEKVHYPGLPSHPDHEVAVSQMSGFGGVVTFQLAGDLQRCSRFIDACRLPLIGPSLGGVESLIEQPALMSYYELTPEQRLAIGIPDGLVRLSVGVEAADDLIADLEQALARAAEG
jgi:cystathionine gamma-synthase